MTAGELVDLPLGLTTLRCRTERLEPYPPGMVYWARVALRGFPDHPVRIDVALLAQWGIPAEPGTDFWIRCNITEWYELGFAVRTDPATAWGLGEPPGLVMG